MDGTNALFLLLASYFLIDMVSSYTALNNKHSRCIRLGIKGTRKTHVLKRSRCAYVIGLLAARGYNTYIDVTKFTSIETRVERGFDGRCRITIITDTVGLMFDEEIVMIDNLLPTSEEELKRLEKLLRKYSNDYSIYRSVTC